MEEIFDRLQRHIFIITRIPRERSFFLRFSSADRPWCPDRLSHPKKQD